MSDYITTADLMEDWCQSRLEADLEMAEFAAAGREIERQRAAGICPHSHGYGYAGGKEYYPGQGALRPGQFRCTDLCGQVIPDPFEVDENNCRWTR